MSIVDLRTFLDRLFNGLMGSFITLLLLSQFGSGDFLREAGFVLLAVVPLAALDIWQRRKKSGGGTLLSIHLVISATAFLTLVALFVAKHSFEVGAVGYWTFLPLIVFFWADFFAGREADVSTG